MEKNLKIFTFFAKAANFPQKVHFWSKKTIIGLVCDFVEQPDSA